MGEVFTNFYTFGNASQLPSAEQVRGQLSKAFNVELTVESHPIGQHGAPRAWAQFEGSEMRAWAYWETDRPRVELQLTEPMSRMLILNAAMQALGGMPSESDAEWQARSRGRSKHAIMRRLIMSAQHRCGHALDMEIWLVGRCGPCCSCSGFRSGLHYRVGSRVRSRIGSHLSDLSQLTMLTRRAVLCNHRSSSRRVLLRMITNTSTRTLRTTVHSTIIDQAIAASRKPARAPIFEALEGRAMFDAMAADGIVSGSSAWYTAVTSASYTPDPTELHVAATFNEINARPDDPNLKFASQRKISATKKLGAKAEITLGDLREALLSDLKKLNVSLNEQIKRNNCVDRILEAGQKMGVELSARADYLRTVDSDSLADVLKAVKDAQKNSRLVNKVQSLAQKANVLLTDASGQQLGNLYLYSKSDLASLKSQLQDELSRQKAEATARRKFGSYGINWSVLSDATAAEIKEFIRNLKRAARNGTLLDFIARLHHTSADSWQDLYEQMSRK